jgi:NADH:flavin oxidoreductase / NADH oxidase family
MRWCGEQENPELHGGRQAMSSITTPKLFCPFILGTATLRHRVVMAPLARLRSDQPGDIPGDLMAEYYAQRASLGGFIVTESTEITPEASAYQGAPGIYTDAQMADWRKITDANLRTDAYGGIPLNSYNRATFYSAGAEGYIDYPSYNSSTVN